MRLTKEICIFCCICLFMSGCALLPHPASQVDPRSVYVWPETRCPSDDGRRSIALGAAVGGILLSNLVSGLVGIPVAALTEAADADKAGYTATGINARFYYEGINDKDNKIKFAPPGCYVLAYTKPTDKKTSWCDEPVFQSSMKNTCANGAMLLDKIQEEKPNPQSLAVPDFYAEIELESSGHANIVLPKIVALYYPKSLLQPGSVKPRTVSIKLEMISSENNDPLKNAKIAMILSGITPGDNIPATNLLAIQTGWANLPSIDVSKDYPESKAGERYLPITISPTLHEVGEPSAFLAAFAKAFSSSSADYSKAITNSIIPSSTK